MPDTNNDKPKPSTKENEVAAKPITGSSDARASSGTKKKSTKRSDNADSKRPLDGSEGTKPEDPAVAEAVGTRQPKDRVGRSKNKKPTAAMIDGEAEDRKVSTLRRLISHFGHVFKAAATSKKKEKKPSKTAPKTKRTAQQESLPIFALKDELVAAVRANQVLIVIGETGSGKSTQITQYMLEDG